MLSLKLTTNQAQDRGLAPARDAHQGRDFPSGHLQGHAIQNDALSVPEGQVTQFNKGVCGGHELKNKIQRKPAFVMIKISG
jgi:hypothetical protein